jgi:hypothetical protein
MTDLVHLPHGHKKRRTQTCHMPQRSLRAPSPYAIERDIPAIGTAEREAWRDAAHHSNAVLAAMQAEQKHVQWEHSYVAADKTFCIYMADNEALGRCRLNAGFLPIAGGREATPASVCGAGNA